MAVYKTLSNVIQSGVATFPTLSFFPNQILLIIMLYNIFYRYELNVNNQVLHTIPSQ